MTRYIRVYDLGNRVHVLVKFKSNLVDDYHADRELNCTKEQFNKSMDAWKAGTYIQDAFPYLTADEREFLQTGNILDRLK